MTNIITSRICACGCAQRFTPPTTRPGQLYIHNHKPAGERKAAPERQELRRNDQARRELDYKIALQTMRRELAVLEAQIDALDDRIVPQTQDLNKLHAEKERLTELHLSVVTAAESLEALLGDTARNDRGGN